MNSFKLPHENTPQRSFNRKRSFWLLLLVIFSVIILFKLFPKASKTNAIPVQSVVLAKAHTQNVPIYLSGLGTVTPTYSVTVRTQINGQLLRVLFKEGQMVKAGELLAEIDPRPYLALLTQYQGQLARDQALLANARLDLTRYQTLWKQDSVAKQTLDTQKSLVLQNEGIVNIDQGLIESTQLNLTYCKITAPISGRVGLRLVDPGNYVQVSDATGIAVINMLDPITIVFTLPEDTLPEVMQQIHAGNKLPVDAYDRSQAKLLERGQLLTVDNQIDTTTGTVKLKAQFQNSDNRFFPNQFVNIKLQVKTLPNAIIVPTAAIQQGVNGAFVYLFNQDNTVHLKQVAIGVTIADDTVVQGISAGQLVVVEGADKLTDGAKVKTATAPPPGVKSSGVT